MYMYDIIFSPFVFAYLHIVVSPSISVWQTLSHNVVHLAQIEIQTRNISGDRHWLHR